MTQSSDVRSNLLYFKRVPEGFVFRAPNPWIFGAADHYLVSETQRDAIAAILLPQRPRTRGGQARCIRIGTVCRPHRHDFSSVRLHSQSRRRLAVRRDHAARPPCCCFGAISIVARRSLRRLAPILAAAQRTEQRITNAELLEFARDRSSLKQSWLTAVAFGCVSILSLAALVSSTAI